MDVFICTEEASGIPFFDIDCNTDCWDSIHIAHCAFASFALIQVIPVGMYFRVKFQEIPPDLNILTNPRFIFIKTAIIIFMIVVSKIIRQYENILILCLSAGMLSMICLHIIMQPFNYRRINLYLSSIGIIYVFTIIFCALSISKTLILIAIMSFTFLCVILCFILQYKFPWIFPKMLSFQKSHKIEGMIRFQFSHDDKQLFEGKTKEQFLVNIQHHLQTISDVIVTNLTDVTDEYEVRAPCGTLN